MAESRPTKDQGEAKFVSTITELRLAHNDFKEFFKATEKHYAALRETINTDGRACMYGDYNAKPYVGTTMFETLTKVCIKKEGDIGEGLTSLANVMREAEVKRQAVVKSIGHDLLASMRKHLDTDKADLEQFDKDVQAAQKRTKGEVAKLEKQSKTAGKRGGQVLKQALDALDKRVREQEKENDRQLRELLFMRRRRYCKFLSEWVHVANAMGDMASEVHAALQYNLEFWRELSKSGDKLPEQDGGFVRRPTQERTLLSLDEANQKQRPGGGGGTGPISMGGGGGAGASQTLNFPVGGSQFGGGGGGGNPLQRRSFGGTDAPKVALGGSSMDIGQALGGGFGGPPPFDRGSSLAPPRASFNAGAPRGSFNAGASSPPPPVPAGGPPPVPAGGPPPPPSAGPPSFGGGGGGFGGGGGGGGAIICRARALYDLEAEQAGDLEFREGDIIEVVAKDESSQWWTGCCQRTGMSGMFPANYVEEI